MAQGKTSWGWGNFIAIAILAAIIIIGGSLLGNYVLEKESQKGIAGTETFFQPVVEKTISYEGQNDKTALELLQEEYQVETQDSSIGIFVISIDQTANEDNKYWMFYIDGRLASLGADQYKTQDGENIEWRYESLQF